MAFFYLSDRTSSPGGNRLLDWSKTLAVAGVVFLWSLVGFGLCVALARSTTVVGLVFYVIFSMALPLFILDAFKECRFPCCRKGMKREADTT